ncbi:hypothetical protein DFJ58DRAFT_844944 [Suillus subalutaceus]|uniref:uncharacterized protein n=1 Tax=Suillus subalutaceus TaxID=48586 RepID=UPI001B86C050|nr:uncharacterized protein DFJ58DRAFT_844944 [Suillus subalutaceus]KAG1841696.1 hypothetical protein DFJ58DRAFT_844944 [Suillus subalutaceus]
MTMSGLGQHRVWTCSLVETKTIHLHLKRLLYCGPIGKALSTCHRRSGAFHTHKVKIHKGLGIKQVIDGFKPHTLPSLLNMLSNFLHAVLNLANYDSPSPMGLGKNRLSLDSNLTLSHPCSIRRLNPQVSPEVGIVPPKLYDVEVVQFWRGEEEPLRPYPLHWAIYVETRNRKNYAIDIRLSQPLENSEDLRGSYSVGSVSWAELAEMETILLRVDIIHDVPWWNGQDWVDDALRYLKCWGFSGIIEETKLAWLQDKMCWLLEGCDGIQNAVEFVGDSGDLACPTGEVEEVHPVRMNDHL